MSIGTSVLAILGLAPYLQDAQTVITVSKDAYEAIKDAKEMLDGPEGQKFKSAVLNAIHAAEGGAHELMHPAPSETTSPAFQYPAGQYVWDGFQGWVWVPAEN